MRFAIFFLAFSVLFFNSGRAAATDVNEMLAQCTDFLELVDAPSPGADARINPFKAGQCDGFVSGVIQTGTLYEASGQLNPPIVCFPKAGVKRGPAIRQFVKYLNEHPNDLHKDSGVLLILALRESFRCPSAAGKGR
jgi:hypothetical protein